MQSVINTIYLWAKRNKACITFDKTNCMTFRNSSLKNVFINNNKLLKQVS